VGDELRRKWQNPEAILSDIGLRLGHIFMDIGCGDGFFALPAARIVGESGRVCGVDVSRPAIQRLGERAEMEGLHNLSLHAARAEDTVLCESCADFVFFGIVLHDFADLSRVLMNARKMLKPVGRLVNVDWKKVPMPFGPPFEKRFDENQAVKLITQAGFGIEVVHDVGLLYYVVIARPILAEHPA
jgi:ubiquinone/menaquinone biosynthesis C-methylase UbiE